MFLLPIMLKVAAPAYGTRLDGYVITHLSPTSFVEKALVMESFNRWVSVNS